MEKSDAEKIISLLEESRDILKSIQGFFQSQHAAAEMKRGEMVHFIEQTLGSNHPLISALKGIGRH